MVVNAPPSNIVSAAELAVGAAARRGPQHRPGARRAEAPASGSARSTPASSSTDKIVGVVGLGRIGVLVAQRLSAFGMRGASPTTRTCSRRAPRRSACAWSSLDELLAESDFITVHLPKTAETVGLIGDDALRKVKPTVRIVNAARGGIVDEAALLRALHGRPGRRRRARRLRQGAVHRQPAVRASSSVVATPHLGACTDEAQEKAGIAVARSVRLALAGELVPDAVNVQGGVDRRGRPARAAAGREARPDLHRAGRRGRSRHRRRGPRRDRRARRHGARAGCAQGRLRRRRRGAGVLRQRAAAGRGARRRGRADDQRREPGPPQPADGARHAARRHGGVGLRHADRPAAGSRSWSRSTASTSTSCRPSTWRSSATTTGPASSAPSVSSSATPGSTSAACR